MPQKERFDVWTYASASSITTSGDHRGTYWPGMRVALKQTTIKFFVIESVTYSAPNTVITLNGMGLYSLVDAPITAHIDSVEVYPKGFPVQVATFACGLAGGQTITGGTAESDNLTLVSTAHATKGLICFGSSAYDEANNRLGIGLQAPEYPLHVKYSGDIIATIEAAGEDHYANLLLKPTGIEWAYLSFVGPGLAIWSNDESHNCIEVAKTGAVWILGNCSAESFTDRTAAFSGDALAAIEAIKSDVDGNIDHLSLPGFAQYKRIDEGKEIIERDIGNMVSVLTTAVQQLSQALSEKDTQIKDLLARVEALETQSKIQSEMI